MSSSFPKKFRLGELSYLEEGCIFAGTRISLNSRESNILTEFLKTGGRPVKAKDIYYEQHGCRKALGVITLRLRRKFNNFAQGEIIFYDPKDQVYRLNTEILDRFDPEGNNPPILQSNIVRYGPLAATISGGWKLRDKKIHLAEQSSRILEIICEAEGRDVLQSELFAVSEDITQGSLALQIMRIRNAFRDKTGGDIINVRSANQTKGLGTTYALNTGLIGHTCP